MKKRFLCMLAMAIAFAVATILSPHTAHAIEWQTVAFAGVVTRPDGTPVPNVMVMVDCINTPSGFTDAHGHYHIEGSAHLCLGDTIAVTTYIKYSPNLAAHDVATLLDSTAYATTTPNTINKADIKMGMKTIDVPEYGWAGGIVAASSGIGIIAYIRYAHGRTVSRSA